MHGWIIMLCGRANLGLLVFRWLGWETADKKKGKYNKQAAADRVRYQTSLISLHRQSCFSSSSHQTTTQERTTMSSRKERRTFSRPSRASLKWLDENICENVIVVRCASVGKIICGHIYIIFWKRKKDEDDEDGSKDNSSSSFNSSFNSGGSSLFYYLIINY